MSRLSRNPPSISNRLADSSSSESEEPRKLKKIVRRPTRRPKETEAPIRPRARQSPATPNTKSSTLVTRRDVVDLSDGSASASFSSFEFAELLSSESKSKSKSFDSSESLDSPPLKRGSRKLRSDDATQEASTKRKLAPSKPPRTLIIKSELGKTAPRETEAWQAVDKTRLPKTLDSGVVIGRKKLVRKKPPGVTFAEGGTGIPPKTAKPKRTLLKKPDSESSSS